MSVPRIVDAVFDRDSGPRRRGLALALGAGLALHGAVVGWGAISAPSLEIWSADLATKVHAELTREQVVDLPPPPVEKPAPPPPPAPEPAAPLPAAQARRSRAPRAAPPPPAQAGKIIAADPTAAVDLPGTTFVTGTAPSYAGGVTSATGTSKTAVSGPTVPGPPPAPGPPMREAQDLSTPVVLDETAWSCDWPQQADSQEVYEQSVIIQVRVRADGTAESVKLLSDPGAGFAAAARTCALSTRFAPARDREGHPVPAESPPIRVHFTR